jgi:protein arginine N-methyltransferase 1
VSVILDEHRQYLSDSSRLDAFRRALAQTVKPGDVVLDLASGTGILGLLACQAGARHVYALEQTGLAGLAREIAAANGYADRITVIREHSTRAALPEPVDCIVCDQIGHFGFEAGVFELTDDARRWLKPGGRIIPAQVQLWISLVEHPDVRQRIAFWNTRPADLDFGAAQSIATNSGYPVALDPSELLAAPQRLVAVDLPHSGSDWFGGEIDIEVTRDGVLDGVGGWFVAELAPGVTLTNQPGHPQRIGRRNVVLPMTSSTKVSAGDRVHVKVRVRPVDTLVIWDVSLTRENGETITVARATTFAGFLVSREDLSRTAPFATPRLTRAGEARKALLLLIDGQHSVHEIEQQLQDTFPDLLPSRERAAEFVAEVIAAYARE